MVTLIPATCATKRVSVTASAFPILLGIYGDVSQIGNLIDVGASDVNIVVTYNQSGTAATAGAATVTVLYVQNNNLS
jgi:hypothetical protein